MPDFRTVVAWLCVTTFGGIAYLDGPPAGHTGGFGEPTCGVCHFGNPVNSDQGALRIVGKDNLTPGGTTLLTIELSSDGLSVAGFQMSVRNQDGYNVGLLRSPDVNTHVVTDSAGVQYVQHTRFGTENSVVRDGVARWVVELELPPTTPDSLVLNVAANASNGDNSALGDYIFVHEFVVAANSNPNQ